MSRPPFTLPADFWSGFHRRFWGRRGTVLSAPGRMPLVTADHVFETLVAASEHWGGADRSFVPELFVEHAQALTDIDRFLPTAADPIRCPATEGGPSGKQWSASMTAIVSPT